MYQVQDRKNSALYRLVRWIPTGWLYLPVLLVSAIFAFGGPWSVSATVAGRCAFLFAAIGIVCQIFRWKAAVGFQVALAFLYCASALLLMKVAFFLLIIGGPIALLWGGGVVVLPLLMLAVPSAIITMGLVTIEFSPKWSLGVLVAAVVVATAIPTSLNEPSMRPYRAFEPYTLVPDMNTINKCLHQYAALHPDSGYPQSLQQLGPQGSGCLSGQLLSPMYKGYEVRYQAGARDASGKFVSYSVEMEESPHGEDWAKTWTDESGLVYFSYPGPRGHDIPVLNFPEGEAFGRLWRCLADAKPAAGALQPAASAEAQVRHCMQPLEVGYEHASIGAYDVDYAFDQAGASLQGFHAQARPHIYGGAIRSYLVIGTYVPCTYTIGTVVAAYGTADDRPATASDPPGEPRELRTWAGSRPINCRQ